ncbi:MAG: 6-carboxytetrahydropterin synthase [Perlabentimonas sp.]
MTRIRLTKEFTFEMAHLLEGYDGPCSNIHGHSYKLEVTVIGSPINDEKNPKHGMVMDFGQLKSVVNEQIVSQFDHVLLVNRKSKLAEVKNELPIQTIVEVDYQPTCENLLPHFAKLISENLPEEVKLHSLKLHETATSYAEWYASDNA